jgi:DNA-binding transcriptional ArsR family regulator
VVYVAPIGIPHYVAAHWYRPPTEFIEAVMRCPEYGSTAYEAALTEANGGVVPPLLARRWAAAVCESAGSVSFGESRSALSAIRDYLAQHPEAEDTADGVERCWLAGSASRPAVERALASLVKHGQVCVSVREDGSRVYSTARQVRPH